jgi:putative ATP-binding cassette transporter
MHDDDFDEGDTLLAGRLHDGVPRAVPLQVSGFGCFGKRCESASECAKAARPWWWQPCSAQRGSPNRMQRWMPLVWTVAATAFCLLETAVLVEFSNVQRRFSTSLHDRDEAAFWIGIRDFCVVIGIAAPLFVTSAYLQNLLTLKWRYWLTDRFVRRYLAKSCRPFFELTAARSAEGCAEGVAKASAVRSPAAPAAAAGAAVVADDPLDNPDQRISLTIAKFTSTSTALAFLVVGKLSNLAAFLVVLWSIAPKLVLFLAVYTAVGSGVALKLFGTALARLTRESLVSNANFRFALIRVRELAESVAFYAGETYELASANATLSSLFATLHAQLRWSTGASFFSFVLDYVTILAPYVFLAPLYFADATFEFGTFAQAS